MGALHSTPRVAHRAALTIIFGTLLWILAGCSGKLREPVETESRESSSRLSSAAQLVWGFEQPSSWSSKNSSLASTTQHSEGTYGLLVTVGQSNTATVSSVSIASPVDPTSTLAFDLMVPPATTWYGQVLLFLNAPSIGLSNLALPAHSIPFPYAVFQRVQFTLPNNVVSLLNGSFGDLQVRIEIDGRAGPYILDNLRFISELEASTPVAAVRDYRILGFEDPTLWVAQKPAVLTSNGRVVQGTHSLGVSGMGWTRLDSAPLQTPGRSLPYIAFDFLLPSPQINPSWYGTIELLASVPSAGITNVTIGTKNLTGLELDIFQRIQFSVPTDLGDALRGEHRDLTFTLVINVPDKSPGTYLLDNLRQESTASSGNDNEYVPDALPPLTVNDSAAPIPGLGGSGEEAIKSARDFISWGLAAKSSQINEARVIIHSARNNADITAALINEMNLTDDTLGRNLIILSILGEIQNSIAEDYLIHLVDLPGPAVNDAGMITPWRSLAALQGKAVDGLAFMRTARSNAKLLETIQSHWSSVVRAEAIRAYLDNNRRNGRAQVQAVVRPDEAILLDSFDNVSETDPNADFDEQLQTWLANHPDASFGPHAQQ